MDTWILNSKEGWTKSRPSLMQIILLNMGMQWSISKETVINYQSKQLDEEPEHNPHKHLIKKKTSKIELKRSSNKIKKCKQTGLWKFLCNLYCSSRSSTEGCSSTIFQCLFLNILRIPLAFTHSNFPYSFPFSRIL